MELIKDHYYAFPLPRFKVWFKSSYGTNNEDGIGNWAFESIELTPKMPLKFIRQTDVWDEKDYVFEYWNEEHGTTMTGTVGIWLVSHCTKHFSDFFKPFKFHEFLPEKLVGDLRDVLNAINTDESKEFLTALYDYEMGSDANISFSLEPKQNDAAGDDELGPDIPEFSFDIILEAEQFRIIAYNGDTGQEDYFTEIIYTNEGCDKKYKNWEENKTLLIDRIKLYSDKLSFVFE